MKRILQDFFSGCVFLLLIIYLVLPVNAPANGSETNTITVYRPHHSKTDKHYLFLQIDFSDLDSLPAGCALQYTTRSSGLSRIYGRIRSYPGWPYDKIEITTIPHDTTYIKAEVGRDIFGNANLKFTAVSKADALRDLSATASDCVLSRSDIEGYVPGDDLKGTGTGFLISNTGLIVTNYHVVEDAFKITVKNINGNKELSADATVIAKDKNNDLVILKIPDSLVTKTAVPYNIKKVQSDLGESVSVFGYPLTTTMGSDVKLTNGIISSVNGYEGNANSYQLTAPIQPGNSGGPVFDQQARLTGVVNAKHLQAENATYAIKSTYLLNFLESVPEYQSTFVNSQLGNMQLVDQAKELQKLVYIIEVR